MNNHKNSVGNQMSLPKSTTLRRVSLLAGSSLVAAGLTAAASLGVALTPSVAAAQTCTPATAPAANPGADTYTCSGTPFAGGITYSSAGNLTVNATTPGMDVGTTGVTLTGNGADNVTFNASGEIDGVGLTGALLGVTTGSGDITINAAALDADQSAATAMTHGILASSGSGDVTMTVTGSIDAEASGGNLGGQAGIEAHTGGAGSIDIMTSGSVSGRLYGIRAEASGAGAVNINATSGVVAHSTAGIAGIHATAGSGPITITGGGHAALGTGVYIETGGGVIFNGSGTGQTGVYIDAGGDVDFTGFGTGAQYGVYLEDVAAGTTSTLNLTRSSTGGLAGIAAQGDGELVVNIVRSVETLDFDFHGMAQSVDVTVVEGGLWRVSSSALTVPDGNFSISIDAGGALAAGNVLSGIANANVWENPTIITFAAPDAVLVNNGVIVVGAGMAQISTPEQNATEHEAELRLVGLDEFRHSGLIVMGNSKISMDVMIPGVAVRGVYYDETDDWADDILSMPGTHWVGEGGEIVFDVNLTGSQANCERAPVTGDLGAADCLMLVGGSTEGVTYVTVHELLGGDRGRVTNDGILLVDVSGGESAQGHFVLSPTVDGYTSAFGGSLDKGLYQFVLVYDEDTQQHVLRGMPSGAAHQLPILASGAHALWRLSTGSWLNRQADLRNDLQEGIGGGVWLRASGENSDRDLVSTSMAGGQSFTFDNSQSQSSYALTGGLDLVSAASGDSAFVAGVMAGYAHAELEYEASPNLQQMDGWTGGLYASYLAGGLFVDAAINANRLVMDNDVPAFRFFPESAIVSSRLLTVGGQVEAGWRLPMSGGLFVEPLAGVSYVRAAYDDITFRPDDASRPGLEVSYDDPTSLRASIGGRVGLDGEFGPLRTQISLLGRLWNEFDGENTAIVHNLAFPDDPDIALTDEFAGQFTEFGVGASIYSPGGAVSGFFNFGGQFGDDYDSQAASAGVRVNW